MDDSLHVAAATPTSPQVRVDAPITVEPAERTIAEIIGFEPVCLGFWDLPGEDQLDLAPFALWSTPAVDDLLAWLFVTHVALHDDNRVYLSMGWHGIKPDVTPTFHVRVQRIEGQGGRSFTGPTLLAALEAAVRSVDGV